MKRSFLKSTKKRVLAGVLAASMVLGVAVVDGIQVKAEVSTEADLDTTQKYLDESFLGNPNSTEYAGRIWTDKTVQEAENSQFTVSYSALATSKQVTGQTKAPLDVVFIIDVSNSMNDDISSTDNTDRIVKTVEAVNDAIEKIMAMNENTRVGLVAFSNNATVLLPLDHYTKYTERNWYGGVTTYDYVTYSDDWVYARGVNSSNNTVRNNRQVNDGTNIQHGIYTGMELLDSENNTTVTIGGAEIQRIPAVIMLSDGAPTYSCEDSEWWDPTISYGIQGPGSSPYYGNGMLAMMTGAYMKKQINNNYNPSNTTGYDVKFYTIGMGITALSNYESGRGGQRYTGEQHLAYLTLNPKEHWGHNNTMAQSMKDAWNEYADNDNTKAEIRVNSNDEYELEHPNDNDITEDNLKNYVDKYYPADDANSVTDAFTNLVNTIALSAPEVPTQVYGNDPLSSGFLTYTDPIGHFMEVKSLDKLTWGNTEYTLKQTDGVTTTSETIEGKAKTVTTYVFDGQYDCPIASHKHYLDEGITIRVIEDNLTGHQTMEIKLAAKAIPLRVNSVTLDATGNVTAHTNNGQLPIKIDYTVGLIDEAMSNGHIATELNLNNSGLEADVIAERQADYQKYLETHKNATDGTVNFYTNYYDGTNYSYDGHTAGNTTVEFEPSHTNPFYYIQDESLIYTKNGENYELVTSVVGSSAETVFADDTIYYYKETFYEGRTIVTKYVARTGEQLKRALVTQLTDVDDEVTDNKAPWTRVTGSPRVNKIHVFEGYKTENATETAQEFYAPIFVHDSEKLDPYAGYFRIYLGNNGVLKAKAAGELEISKTVTADDGLDAPDVTFVFTVDFNGLSTLEGTYNYYLLNASGEAIIGANGRPVTGTITDGGTIELKDGQKAQIINLPPGTTYSVHETAVAGFTQTNTGGSGSVVAGENAVAAFTNHYQVTPLNYPTAAKINGEKILSGRDIVAGDAFVFQISSTNADAKLPSLVDENGQIKLTGKTASAGTPVEFDFGTIEFKKPGTYTYTIIELTPAMTGKEPLTGVSYSKEAYSLEIKIVDNGNGTLSVASETLTKTQNWLGEEISRSAEKATFTNVFSAESEMAGPVAYKQYTDYSGHKPLVNDMFTFTIRPVGSLAADAPMPENETGHPLYEGSGANRVYTVHNRDGFVSFGMMEFTLAHANARKVFTYELKEVIPENATQNTDGTYTLNGMTYDPTVYYVDFSVSLVDSVVTVEREYYTLTASGSRTVVDPAQVIFNNSYKTTEITLSEDTSNPLAGSKTLIGRDMKAGDTFTFNLSTTDATTLTAINAKEIKFNGSAVTNTIAARTELLSTSIVKTIEDGTGADGVAVDFAFDAVTFTKQGVYKFEVKEVIPGETEGITYDKHVCSVTVTVKDENGTLKASVSYNNSTAEDVAAKVDTSKAVFVNNYEATIFAGNPVNINGKKVLSVPEGSNRQLKAGEFFFNVTPLNGAPIGDVARKLVSNEAGTNVTPTEGDIYLLKNVTYTAAGTYEYIINERVPGGAQNNKLDGVLFDSTTYYKVVIVVEDMLNGTLEVTSQKIYMSTDSGANYGTEPVATGVVFTNIYTTEETDSVNVTLKKVVTGDYLESGDYTLTDNAFQFKVVPVTLTNEGYEDLQTVPDGMIITLPNDNVVSNLANGNITIPEIKFTKAGTYRLKVTEQVPTTNPLNNMTYDNQTLILKFVVVDNGVGKLIARTELESGSTFFENRYNPVGTVVGNTSLVVTKTYLNHNNVPITDWNGASFSFKLAPQDDETMAAVKSGAIEMTDGATEMNEYTSSIEIGDNPANTVNHSKAFGNITFNKIGTYKFSLWEDALNPIAGVEYDDIVRTVTITVTDNPAGDGKLECEVAIDKTNGWTFTNKYDPTDAVLNGVNELKITKNFTGRENNEWLDTDKFYFTLQPADDATKAATVSGNNIEMPKGYDSTIETDDPTAENDYTTTIEMNKDNKYTLSFGNIHFKAVGTYKFKIKEMIPSDAVDNVKNGITYDTTEYVVDVNVAESAPNSGVLVATITNKPENTDEWLTFTNVYKLTEYTFNDDQTSANLEIKKEFKGAEWENQSFTFRLEATDETLGKILDDATTTVSSPSIVIEKDGDNGDSIDGIAKISVKSDSTNQIVTGNTVSGNSISTIQSVDVGSITFRETGTYTFKISEEIPAEDQRAGIVYDDHEVLITIVVRDDGNGNLVTEGTDGTASITITGEQTFVNEYRPKPATAQFTGTKILKGRDFVARDNFVFELQAIMPDAPMPGSYSASHAGGSTGTYDATVGGYTKTVNFGQITYYKAGTYKYKITERVGTTAGVTYDTATWDVTVVVQPDSNNPGQLVSDVTYQKENASANTTGFEFTNIYAPASVKINPNFTATKTMVPAAGNSFTMQGGEFTYTLTPAASNNAQDPVQGMLTDGKLTAVNKADSADGAVDNVAQIEFTNGGSPIAELEYTTAGTYVYTVREVTEDAQKLPGVIYDAEFYTITVTVEDHYNGQLTASVKVTNHMNKDAAMEFSNGYIPEAVSTNIQGTKKLTVEAGTSTLEAGMFKFELIGKDDAPMPEGDGAIVTNDVNGDFVFGAIKFEKPGVFEYEIHEINEGKSAITYDDTVYTVEIEVKDVEPITNSGPTASGNNLGSTVSGGNLTATVSGGNLGDGSASQKPDGYGKLSIVKTTITESGITAVDDVLFENIYKAEPAKGVVVVDGSKKLVGRAIKNGEFIFVLTGNGENVELHNDKDGKFTWTKDFEEEGEFVYSLTEQKSNVADGIIYDESAYTIKVDVKDIGGRLSAKVTCMKDNAEAEQAVFENTYQPKSTKVTLAVAKKLTGRALTVGEFEFELLDETGTVIDTAKNDAAGTVTFKELEFDTAKEYKYKVREKAGKVENVTYDGNEYEVIIKVTDDLEGQLVAEVEKGKDIVFVNVYKEPVKPEKKDPAPSKKDDNLEDDEPAEVYLAPQQPTQGGGSATGDNANTIGFVVLAIAAVLGLGGLAIYKRKKR